MRISTTLLMAVALGFGCRKAPENADPAFNDALTFMFQVFEGEEADLAFATRALEDQLYASMDPTAKKVNDRSLQPDHLTLDDLGDLARDDRDLADALPVAVATVSNFTVDQQTHIQMLTDHTPVEPYSPDHYERSFLEGEDCWQDRGCLLMRTSNDLTKKNLLMTVDYVFLKDFRWIDLNLPDPSEVPEGEEAINEGEPRWAFIGRSWTEESFAGRSENVFIHQSYTMEVWIPRDGDQTLRMLALWSETDLGFAASEEQILGTTKVGIDENFEAAEKWLEDNL